MKIILFILFSFFSLTSFKTEDDGNKYFYEITEELKPIVYNSDMILNLKQRELEKFKKTKEKKYLISAKYIGSFIYHNTDNLNHIFLIYELIKLNHDQYQFISMTSNFNLALKFENNSPKLAMEYLDRAIKYNEEMSQRYYISHLYHAKGRFYYNDGNYNLALYYFDLALKNFKPHEKLYIASMYNNFALTYDKQGKINLAIRNLQKGINILENITNPSEEDTDFLHLMKGSLGFYFYKLKEYSIAEKLLLQEFEYYQKKENSFPHGITASNRLFDLYLATNQKDKQRGIINYLISIEPKLVDTSRKITVNEIIQKYYSINNETQNLKDIDEKLIRLNHKYYDENNRNTKQLSDVLNNQVIKNINERYSYEIDAQKKKNILLVSIACLCIIILTVVIISVLSRIKREREMTEKQKAILENNKNVLEQNVNLQKEKIKNLQQNLNLKIETEKMFLENLKKIKKTKNIDSEEMLKDMLLKVNNLMQIDKKNYSLINESSIENKIFIEKLANQYTTLTDKELKLCTYFRMNLSSKEISSLEHATTGSIRVYKTRVKSKLGLDREDDLSFFLNKI